MHFLLKLVSKNPMTWSFNRCLMLKYTEKNTFSNSVVAPRRRKKRSLVGGPSFLASFPTIADMQDLTGVCTIARNW